MTFGGKRFESRVEHDGDPLAGFVLIPNSLFRDARLGGNARSVWGWLRSQAGGRRISVEAIAEGIGVDRKTVLATLPKLAEFGWLVIEDEDRDAGRFTARTYRTVIPAAHQVQKTDLEDGRHQVQKLPSKESEISRAEDGKKRTTIEDQEKTRENTKKTASASRTPSVGATPPHPAQEQVLAGDYPPEFEELWRIFPRRVGKGEAAEAWVRAVYGWKYAKRWQPPRITHQQLIDRIRAYSVTHPQRPPNLATWLNQKRWDDDLSARDWVNEQAPVARPTQADMFAELDKYAS